MVDVSGADEEIQPLKSTNLIERGVSEWDAEDVNIEQGLLFEPILKSLRERTLSVFHEHLRVVSATLDNDAGIIGNAALALDCLDSRSSNP